MCLGKIRYSTLQEWKPGFLRDCMGIAWDITKQVQDLIIQFWAFTYNRHDCVGCNYEYWMLLGFTNLTLYKYQILRSHIFSAHGFPHWSTKRLIWLSLKIGYPQTFDASSRLPSVSICFFLVPHIFQPQLSESFLYYLITSPSPQQNRLCPQFHHSGQTWWSKFDPQQLWPFTSYKYLKLKMVPL